MGCGSRDECGDTCGQVTVCSRCQRGEPCPDNQIIIKDELIAELKLKNAEEYKLRCLVTDDFEKAEAKVSEQTKRLAVLEAALGVGARLVKAYDDADDAGYFRDHSPGEHSKGIEGCLACMVDVAHENFRTALSGGTQALDGKVVVSESFVKAAEEAIKAYDKVKELRASRSGDGL